MTRARNAPCMSCFLDTENLRFQQLSSLGSRLGPMSQSIGPMKPAADRVPAMNTWGPHWAMWSCRTKGSRLQGQGHQHKTWQENIHKNHRSWPLWNPFISWRAVGKGPTKALAFLSLFKAAGPKLDVDLTPSVKATDEPSSYSWGLGPKRHTCVRDLNSLQGCHTASAGIGCRLCLKSCCPKGQKVSWEKAGWTVLDVWLS